MQVVNSATSERAPEGFCVHPHPRPEGVIQARRRALLAGAQHKTMQIGISVN